MTFVLLASDSARATTMTSGTHSAAGRRGAAAHDPRPAALEEGRPSPVTTKHRPMTATTVPGWKQSVERVGRALEA